MRHQPDEPRLAEWRDAFVALDHLMDRKIDRHVDELHTVEPVPGRRYDRPAAVPWSDKRIPDEELSQMVQILEGSETSLASVAVSFGYPPSLAERELARYRGATGRYLIDLTH